MRSQFHSRYLLISAVLALSLAPLNTTAGQNPTVEKFDLTESGLLLESATRSGAFVNVAGRRSALFGYEHKSFEAWAYPLKLFSDFQLYFQLDNYPVEFAGTDIMASIEVRPEATVLTYRHAAFTVRQILFAPIDEPAIVMLLEVDSVLPLQITGSFIPDMRLMWPAGLMTGSIGWSAEDQMYRVGEETGQFGAVLGIPGARDISVMPYQEEPKDMPNRFVIDTNPAVARHSFYPIIATGSVEGRDGAVETYRSVLASIPALYEKNVVYYKQLLRNTVSIVTPDRRLNEAYDWARIGVDKGIVKNPLLGTGLVAGFRTSGKSERPGFAWFFGRDALWTLFAMLSYGDFEGSNTALKFLEQFQRDDGKIPHEISQSASLLPWFEEYAYPWASADATPLFVIAHADYYRAVGDKAYLRESWSAIKAAFEFSKRTDTDGNGLVENTGYGHGWVEGGELYPPHEEIYMQGLFIAAARDIAELADIVGEEKYAQGARRLAERTARETESIYWLEREGFYAFATRPYADREEKGLLFVEDTVLPAVPLWFKTLDTDRAQSEIDHIGAGSMTTDWGNRILSNNSSLYDPLSYHNGSVWPLFTGWASLGAYQYGRPHVGYQALMANVLLTRQDALGYITELLSGDFNTAFGRSSHHQIWSEAMVVTPLLRGLLGLSVRDGGRFVSFRPQLPADWNDITIKGFRAGKQKVDFIYHRADREATIVFERWQNDIDDDESLTVEVALSVPLDAGIKSVTVNSLDHAYTEHLTGDRKAIVVELHDPSEREEIIVALAPGTDVSVTYEPARLGARTRSIRVLRSSVENGRLNLLVEGLGQHDYVLQLHSSYEVKGIEGVRVRENESGNRQLVISFDGPRDAYVRRQIGLLLSDPDS